MTPEQQKHRLTLGDAIAINLTGAVVLLQFRLLSFCLIALGAVLLAFMPRLRCKPFCILTAIVIGVSLFLPFDVAVGSYHFGSRRGTSPGGPHFVRFVVGMPKHSRLIQTYGEYVTAGCAWPAAIPPRWTLVWN
jgi:hypothetical protein